MSKKEGCRYYPILVDLRGKRVLVVGGGMVAHRKIETLLEHGASVEVVAKDLDRPVAGLVDKGLIGYGGREFSEAFLNGVFLVIAATSDEELNRRVAEKAQEKGLLVNAVDQPSDCNFIVPSILRRGDLVVSISTSGKSPAFAKKIRRDLEEHFGDEFESFLDVMGSLRESVLSLGPRSRIRRCSRSCSLPPFSIASGKRNGRRPPALYPTSWGGRFPQKNS
jgi:precorrin-2 dehydrogenase / sirohydrochlorin ferrochelatase